MKKGILLLFVIAMIQLHSGCKKATTDAIDCFGESLLISLTHTADATNSKLINFQITYSGSYTVQSVEWQFGDGSTATVNGLTTTHTYTANGNYTVKANVNIKNGGNTCTSSPEKNITIN